MSVASSVRVLSTICSLDGSVECSRRNGTCQHDEWRSYIANEVAYHRTVLDALDTLLVPNATNAELKETLTGVRPAFEAHLRHAESLQQSLGR